MVGSRWGTEEITNRRFWQGWRYTTTVLYSRCRIGSLKEIWLLMTPIKFRDVVGVAYTICMHLGLAITGPSTQNTVPVNWIWGEYCFLLIWRFCFLESKVFCVGPWNKSNLDSLTCPSWKTWSYDYFLGKQYRCTNTMPHYFLLVRYTLQGQYYYRHILV